jgi:hypothetical protein
MAAAGTTRERPCARLHGIEHTAFEQDLQRHRPPGQRQQAAQLAGRHRKAEPVDRHAEAAARSGDAQVAIAGDLEATANANASMAASVGCGHSEIARSAGAMISVW